MNIDSLGLKNLQEGQNRINELIQLYFLEIINYGGPHSENIIKGILCKFISRLNTLGINIGTLLDATKDSSGFKRYLGDNQIYTDEGIANNYYIISRFDFLIGTFSFFEDGIYNHLLEELFTTDELKGMYKSEKNIHHLSIETIIKKLRAKKIIEKKDEDLVIGIKEIRNTLHNNGVLKKDFIFKMLDETFDIEKDEAPNFITIERIITWSDKLLKTFIQIALQTDWENIKDNSIK